MLDQFHWTEQELWAYEKEIKRVRDNAAVLEYKLDHAKAMGKEEGIQLGKKAGIEEGKREVARQLLKLGLPIDQIVAVTGFSPQLLKDLCSIEEA